MRLGVGSKKKKKECCWYILNSKCLLDLLLRTSNMGLELRRSARDANEKLPEFQMCNFISGITFHTKLHARPTF